MLDLITSTRFRRDLRLCHKRGYNLDLLDAVIETLRIPQTLPPKNKDHDLSGNYAGFRECHIMPDWLLTYCINGDTLYLDRTGLFFSLLRLGGIPCLRHYCS